MKQSTALICVCDVIQVVNEMNETVYCTDQAAVCLRRRKTVDQFKLYCRFTDVSCFTLVVFYYSSTLF